MKYRFMYDNRFEFRMKKMAATLRVSRSGYYAWIALGCTSPTEASDSALLKKIKLAFIKTRETYGPRRLAKHLLAEGTTVGRVRLAAPCIAWVTDITLNASITELDCRNALVTYLRKTTKY